MLFRTYGLEALDGWVFLKPNIPTGSALNSILLEISMCTTTAGMKVMAGLRNVPVVDDPRLDLNQEVLICDL